jgi:hypothetical protein
MEEKTNKNKEPPPLDHVSKKSKVNPFDAIKIGIFPNFYEREFSTMFEIEGLESNVNDWIGEGIWWEELKDKFEKELNGVTDNIQLCHGDIINFDDYRGVGYFVAYKCFRNVRILQ